MRAFDDEARYTAYECLYEVLENQGYSNLVLSSKLRKTPLSSSEKSFATALFYGTVTRVYTLDAVLNHFLKNKVEDLDPQVRTTLRMGAWQILYSYGVKDYAAVDSIVSLTKQVSHQGAAKMVNAVLRKVSSEGKDWLSRVSSKNLSVHYSVKPEIAGCFVKWYGQEKAAAILSAYLNTPKVTIRQNPLSGLSRESFLSELQADGISFVKSEVLDYAYELSGDVTDLSCEKSYQLGRFSVQSLSAMLVGHIACPKAGMTVLDTCSAPGGKTTHMAECMEDQGRIDALDANEIRLKMVGEAAERLGIHIIRTMPYDATYLKEEREVLLPEYDLVLCDVPCSGLGLLHRKPDIRLSMSYEKIQNLLPVQASILDNSCLRVKKGGLLVYSTCTVNPNENEKQIEAFLNRHPDFEMVPFERLLPEVMRNQERMLLGAKAGMLTLLPDEEDFDGFFIAKLRRKD